MSSLIFAFPAMAQDKFWISNKIEVGYSKTFISNQIKFNQDEFIKNDLKSLDHKDDLHLFFYVLV